MLVRWMGYFLIGLALLLLFYGGIAYWGWQSGQQMRQMQVVAAQQAELAKQVALAQADISAGSYELAELRLAWVAERGGEAQAAELRAEIGRLQAVALTPSPTPTLTPSPTPTVTPSPTPDLSEAEEAQAAAEAFAELEEMMGDFRWSEAITAVPAFQLRWPSYRRPATDKMLYDAYLAYGQRLLPGDNIEQGLFYLEQARRLGPIPEDVEGQIVFAELYLEGIVFYDVNWPAYLYYFRQLCAYAPLFHESCERLRDGLTRYGDRFAGSLDWCPAAEHYTEARNIARLPASETLNAKWTQARAECQLATPTPRAEEPTEEATAEPEQE